MPSGIEYETGNLTYITGRSMDWNDPTAKTALWTFPRGMEREGGVWKKPIKWASKCDPLVASFYDAGTADVMNEKGSVGSMLYLAESDYGDTAKTGKPTIGAQLGKIFKLGTHLCRIPVNPEYNAINVIGTPHWTIRLGSYLLVPSS